MAAARDAELAPSNPRGAARPLCRNRDSRFIDPGALVQNAATNQTASQPLVTISDSSRCGFMPISSSRTCRSSISAHRRVRDAANPQRALRAAITRTSGELDPATHALVEIDVDNPMTSCCPAASSA